MSPSEPPSSLALDDIMLLDDDDEGIGNNEPSKLLDIQEQLQKQAELIRDLIVQRGYLITQVLEERERWQAERDGWDRTSEALIMRYSRQSSGPASDEELVHRCAVYESENKVMREKVHDAQVRLADLEAELSRLKPLLVIQPSLPTQPLRHDHLARNTMPYPYTQVQGYMSPISHVTSTVPYVLYSASPGNKGRKRKREDHLTSSISGKGKEKVSTQDDVSDGNADDDSDNTEVPPTPAPLSSASHNPYAYMNNLYRQVLSPPRVTSSPTSPLKPPGSAFFGAPNSSPSGAISLNHYAANLPYPYTTTSHPKQPTNFVPQPTPGQVVDAEKGGNQTETSTEVHDLSTRPDRDQHSPSKTPSARRAVTASARRSQHQGKYKTSSILSDARAEHLLLAARKIGRERAAVIAGLTKSQEKLAPEESGKDKAKVKDSNRHSETRHGSISANRSTQQRRRTIQMQSPSTPTPRRVHGSTQPLTDAATFTTTPSRSRETLYKTPRTKSSSTVVSNKDDENLTSAAQTPLDSLLSAARTMMSEDRKSRQIATGQSINSGTAVSADQGKSGHQPTVEDQATEDNANRRRKRRNTITRATATVTPKSRTIEKDRKNASASHDWKAGLSAASKRPRLTGSASVGRKTRSALEVLADQAEIAKDQYPPGSYADPVANDLDDPTGSIETSSIRDRPGTTLTPRVEEGPQIVASTSTAAESNVFMQMEDPAEAADDGVFGTWQERRQRTGEKWEVGSRLSQNVDGQEVARDNVRLESAVRDEAVMLVSFPIEPLMGSKLSSVHSDLGQDKGSSDWDPFGGKPNTASSDPSGYSEGDIDAEGDVDLDSQEAVNE